jgi:lipopolysaccharide export system ATP-binding protein
MPLLEVRGLVKYYGRRKVVDGVNFDVDAGEVVGLLGPNGAGKTTSFRMTMGQITPFDGKVIFNSQEITNLPMFRRARLGMGYLSQETSVFRKLTVEQNILAILEAMPVCRTLGRKLTRAERYERTDEVLSKFGLTRLRKNNAARLSGGERRRLEIARCLVCEPLLILFDEPFTGIDPITIADIRQIVRELAQQKIAILVTDHNVRETLKITDRSYLIKDGQVRTHGSPQQIVHDPVAISEYLGVGFNEDNFGSSPPPTQASAMIASEPEPEPIKNGLSVHGIVEQERLRKMVEGLKTPDYQLAAGQLLEAGFLAVPLLIEALERRDVELRRQAFTVLQQMLGNGAAFDPYAPEAQRRQQIALLRERLERKAS